MRYRPHNYQQTATRFILDHHEAAILLGMGLGKSVITLTAIWQLLLDYFTVSRVLVVAPLRVARDTWPAEVAKWDHLQGLSVAVAVGTKADRLDALAKSAMVTVINRENIPWLVRQYGDSWPFDMVVIDELSSFKNHRAKRFTALVKMRPHVKRWVGLTGTPASNGLMDIWAQFRLLDGGQRLGRFITRYRDKWFLPDKRNGMQVFTYKPRAGAEEEIYDAIADMTLSMRTTDHLTLPDLTVTTTPVVLGAGERAVYEQLKADLVVDLDGQVVDAANAAALSGKLLQLASGAIYDEHGDTVEVHGAKLDALEDIIEAANGQTVLVAYWYRHDRERIQRRFPQARELKTSADIEAWNRGDIPLGLIHPASAGHGLNLQSGGHLLVWFSLTWSLELYQQTNARLYRQGQAEPVTITHLTATGTLDQAVLKALEAKDMTQAALIRGRHRTHNHKQEGVVMHVMTKYLDTRKAAISALQDFAVMEQIIDTTDEQIKTAYDDVTTPASSKLDGMPRHTDLHAGEMRVAATLDRIDIYRARYAQAREYMAWFLPAWQLLTDDDRFVLEAFFLGDGTQDEAVQTVCDHFYVERTSAYQKKSRALARLASALYGQAA